MLTHERARRKTTGRCAGGVHQGQEYYGPGSPVSAVTSGPLASPTLPRPPLFPTPLHVHPSRLPHLAGPYLPSLLVEPWVAWAESPPLSGIIAYFYFELSSALLTTSRSSALSQGFGGSSPTPSSWLSLSLLPSPDASALGLSAGVSICQASTQSRLSLSALYLSSGSVEGSLGSEMSLWISYQVAEG